MRYNDVVEDVGYTAQMKMQAAPGAGQLSNQALNQPKRPGELPVAAATLNERVGVLMKELSDLEKRLGPVTRLQPPSPASAPNQATQGYGASTQLGQAIAGATSNIDVAINGIRDLLDRLEI